MTDSILSNVSDDEETQSARSPEEAAQAMLAEGCPACTALPTEAPEGTNPITGDPFWTQPYCWKCGFRPDATNVNPLTQRYEDFRRFTDSQTQDLAGSPGFRPPRDEKEAEQLRAWFRENFPQESGVKSDEPATPADGNGDDS